jgi:hypothetical protein
MNLTRSNLVLGVLAALLAIPTWLQLQRDAGVYVDLGGTPRLFDGFTADNVGAIVCKQPKAEQPPPDPQQPQGTSIAYDQIVFQRSETGWMLGGRAGLAGAPVLKDRIENDIFTHLRSVLYDRDALVRSAATPEQLAELGLDDAHAFVVQVLDRSGQRTIAQLLVGRDAGQGQTGTEAVRGVYVRRADSTDVVLYELQKPWPRQIGTEFWLDKVLARIEPDKVRRLSLRNTATRGTTFTFAKPPNSQLWEAVSPPAGLGALRQGEVETLVQRLRWIAAQDFRLNLKDAGNLQQLGLLPPAIEIELAVAEGDRERTLKLAVGGKVDGKNEYYLLCNEVQFLLTWPAGTVTAFELDVAAQLFDPAAPVSSPPAGGDDKGK